MVVCNVHHIKPYMQYVRAPAHHLHDNIAIVVTIPLLSIYFLLTMYWMCPTVACYAVVLRGVLAMFWPYVVGVSR